MPETDTNAESPVARPKKWVRWSEDQIAVLRDHYPSGGYAVVSRMTGHCRDSVQSKAASLGIRSDSRRAWTNGEVDDLRWMFRDGMKPSIGSVAHQLGRGRGSVYGKMCRLGFWEPGSMSKD